MKVNLLPQRQKAIAEGRLQPQQQGHPDEGKIKELLVRTNYNLDVTTGQRKYGGPPPASVCHADTPPSEAEVFIGKIPRDMFEGKFNVFYLMQSKLLRTHFFVNIFRTDVFSEQFDLVLAELS